MPVTRLDDLSMLPIGASRAGNTFPTNPMLGDQFDLLQDITLATHAVITSGAGNHNTGYYQSASPIGSIDKSSSLVTGILWYDNNNVNYAPYRRHLVVFTGTVPHALASVTIGGTTYPLRPVSGGTTHIYVSTNAVATNPIPAGSTYQVQALLTDGTKVWPDVDYEPHTYVWDGNYWHRWFALTATDIRDRSATLPRPWLDVSAIAGNINNRFEHLLIDAYGQGISVTDTDHAVINALSLFSPTFDLDDVQHGVFTVEAILTIGTRSSNTLGFGDDNATSWRIDDTIFASGLKALAAFSPGTVTATTLQVSNGVDIYKGATKLGSVHLHFAHDSNNDLGYLLTHTASAGASSDNFTATLHLAVSWSPSDARPAPRPSYRGDWAASTFQIGDEVLHNNIFYKCLIPRAVSDTQPPNIDSAWRAMTG